MTEKSAPPVPGKAAPSVRTDDPFDPLALAGVAVLHLDPELRLTRFSSGAADHFHLAAAAIGQPLAKLAGDFPGAELDRVAREALDRRQLREIELVIPAGRTYLCRIIIAGRPAAFEVGVMIVLVDLTSRRTSADNNPAHDDLRAELAHELRTPLSAMMLWAKLLQEQKTIEPKFFREGLDAICEAVEEQSRLIEDLLDPAKPSARNARGGDERKRSEA